MGISYNMGFPGGTSGKESTYNLYTIVFSHFKYKIQWSLVFYRVVQPSPQTNFKTVPSSPQNHWAYLKSSHYHPQPQATANLVPISIALKVVVKYVSSGFIFFHLT